MTFEIRPLRLDEMAMPVEWAAREGWNPGHSDAGLDHLADVRTVGLDGVVDQQHNYRRSGFVLAHRNVRYAGVAPLRVVATNGRRSITLVPAADVDPSALERYDAAHFGAKRSDFLRAWTTDSSHRALVAVRGSDDGTAGDGTVGDVAGDGVIRPCRDGFKVGPLFATDAATAAQLIEGLVQGVAPGAAIFLDPRTVNAEAVQLAESLGMRPVFETARMYRGEPLDLPIDEVFGITTFELG